MQEKLLSQIQFTPLELILLVFSVLVTFALACVLIKYCTSSATSFQALSKFDRLNLMQAILDNSTSCIFVKDMQRRYLLVNRYALTLFNFKEEYVLGKTDDELFPASFAKMTQSSDLQVLQKKTTIHEEVITGLTERNLSLFTVKAPLLDPYGNVYGICGVSTDVTDHRKSEEQLNEYIEKLEKLTTELIDARIMAEQASQAKNAFLAIMSHELRTPLNSIIGNISLLVNTEHTPKQDTYFNRIISSSNMLLDIINQILDFSKIAAGELKLESIPSDLESIIGEIRKVLSTRADEKKIELKLNFSETKLPKVLTDPTRIKQILLNLIGNAVKFTEKGYVQLDVTPFGNDNQHLWVRFDIADTGIGISKEKLEHLFERFWQADNSNTRRYGGTGLGLSIVKQIVELMGGKISVQSQEGVGSRFTVEMPFPLAETLTEN